ncbi:hypothetical protein KKG45_03905 [bacterium]|nr:hypothetical protein [bacterium]MBU1072372.1 hypothetical protein [bacterium]MBU1676893.1 hypothetical protein [bacterium]
MRSLLLWLFVLACFATTAAANEYLWCFNADEVRAEVDPATAEVTVSHAAALYNCCPDPITYDVQFGDETLFVVEHVAADPPCDCNCCFDLGVKIHDVPPGLWWIGFSWRDEETGEWIEWHGEIVVPDMGQGYAGGEIEPESSGCLSATAVEEPASEQLTWSALKTCYR